jgi:hypothetical protein
MHFLNFSVKQLTDTQLPYEVKQYQSGVELPTTLLVLWVEAV